MSKKVCMDYNNFNNLLDLALRNCNGEIRQQNRENRENRAIERRKIEENKPYRIDSSDPNFYKLLNKPMYFNNIFNIPNIENVKNIENVEKYYNQNYENYQTTKNPILFIPGMAASQLISENTDWGKFPKCGFGQNYDGTIWLPLNAGSDCHLSLLTPKYDRINRRIKTVDGTNIRVKGVKGVKGEKDGSFECCNCLNDSLNCFYGASVYAKRFVNSLIDDGYTVNKDLFALGYDFRLAPHLGGYELNDYKNYDKPGNHFGNLFLRFKSLVETSYNLNNKKVILCGHSEGGLLSTLFLNVCNRVLGMRNWVKKYIQSIISIAPAYDGSPTSTRYLISGGNPGVPLQSDLQWRNIQRYMAGSILLSSMTERGYKDGIMIKITDPKDPLKDEIYKTDGAIGERSGFLKFLRKYSVQVPEFDDIIEIYKDLLEIKLLALHDPEVPVHIIYGSNIKTEAGGYEYYRKNDKQVDFDNVISMYYNNQGDGTVPEGIFKYYNENHSYKFDPIRDNLGSYFIKDNDTVYIKKWQEVYEYKITNSLYSNHVTIMLISSETYNIIKKIVANIKN